MKHRKRVPAVALALLLVLLTAVLAAAQADLVDTDGDWIPDSLDSCPTEGNVNGIGILRGGCPALDTDSDQMPDRFDSCPAEGAPGAGQGIGIDGCLIALESGDVDPDGDGIPSRLDICDFGGDQGYGVNNQGCTITDNDQDGMPAPEDACATQAPPPYQYGMSQLGCILTEPAAVSLGQVGAAGSAPWPALLLALVLGLGSTAVLRRRSR